MAGSGHISSLLYDILHTARVQRRRPPAKCDFGASRARLGSPHVSCVLSATKPVNFRKEAEGWPALAAETTQADPSSGATFMFPAKRADQVTPEQFRVMVVRRSNARGSCESVVALDEWSAEVARKCHAKFPSLARLASSLMRDRRLHDGPSGLSGPPEWA